MNVEHQLKSLLALPRETEWVEFKHNNDAPEEIGEYLSALANAAALHGRDAGYIVWGIEDVTKRVVGTTANPRQKKIGNEELENWLAHLLSPRVDFRIGKAMTNASLRQRLGIEEHNYSTASRIIAETIKAGLVRHANPDNKSRKHAQYVPFWLM